MPAGNDDDLLEDLASFIGAAEPHRTPIRFDSVVEARTFLAAARGVSPPPDFPEVDFPAGEPEPPPAGLEPPPRSDPRRRIPRARRLR